MNRGLYGSNGLSEPDQSGSEQNFSSKVAPTSSSAVSYQNLFQQGFQSQQNQQQTQQNQQQQQQKPIRSHDKGDKKNIKANSAVLSQFTAQIPHKRSSDVPESEETEETEEIQEVVQAVPEVPHVPEISEVPMHNSFNSEIIGPESGQFMVQNLVATADFFVKKAHTHVDGASSVEGAKWYFKMIKIAIKSLLVVANTYQLEPQLEAVVYYKLAKLYFSETENVNRAEDYANRAITVASRNNMPSLQFASEFLGAQILAQVNPNLVSSYLNDRINWYQACGYVTYSHMFTLLKIQRCLVTETATGLIMLQQILRDPLLDTCTRALVLVYILNLHLYRGSPEHAGALLHSVDSVAQQVPTQITAMAYLLRYLGYIQTNNIIRAKEYMLHINSYIQSQQSDGWRQWAGDGTFTVSSEYGVQVSYKVNWVTSDEFVVVFYFLTAISLLTEVSNGKRKAKKVFDRCLVMVNKQLGQKPMSLATHSQLVVRLQYIRYNIQYYQVWMGFLNDDFGEIKHLNEYMLNYNSGHFDTQPHVHFKLLLPRVYYMFAAYYQSKGDIQASKYYYIKVRNLSCTHMETSNAIYGLSLQGLGEFNELYIYSTLHLLVLNEYEVREMSRRTAQKSNPGISTYLKVRGQLHSDLTQAFTPKVTSNSFTLNFVGSNALLKLTYHLLLHIFNDVAMSGHQHRQQENINKMLLEQMGKIMDDFNDATSFPFITNLISYLIYRGTDDVDQKNRCLDKCIATVSVASSSDNDRIISIFILKSLIQHFRQIGENEKASMAELQLEYFYNGVGHKFAFLAQNVPH